MMWRVEKKARVFLALGATDMRKQIPGLSLLVEQELERNLFTGDLFVFCNRRCNSLKILYWCHNGFCVWQKKLDQHRFKWPKTETEVKEIRRHELIWLLEGLDIDQAHQKLFFERVS